MKKLLLLSMFPVFIYGQSLQNTKWDVQTLQGNGVVFFQNDTVSIMASNTISFDPLATYQDSLNFFSVFDLPGPNSCFNVGFYNYQILNDTLTFNVINDSCGGTDEDSRLSFFVNSTWTRLNTGLQNKYQPFTLKTFPNPTNKHIQIEIENYNGNIEAELYDFTGKPLEITNKTSISLANYSTGIYLLKVAYGDRAELVKVIKE